MKEKQYQASIQQETAMLTNISLVKIEGINVLWLSPRKLS
jgi:hypothetical protein